MKDVTIKKTILRKYLKPVNFSLSVNIVTYSYLHNPIFKHQKQKIKENLKKNVVTGRS